MAMASPVTDWQLIARTATGFGLSYVLGFERQLRGAMAGNRTFATVGTIATAVTAVCAMNAPQAVAGVLTGIGFIGAGVVFRGIRGPVHGITTAATLFGVAGLGIVLGYGYLLAGVVVGALLLLILEIPHIPVLRRLDARSYIGKVADDPDLAAPPDQPGDG